MRHSPVRHLITAAMAMAFAAAAVGCSTTSPRALDLPETTAPPSAAAPSTAPPSTAAPTTSARPPTHSPSRPQTVANTDPCVSIEPGPGFYEGGRVASAEHTTPTSRCTTIGVSNVRDPNNPTDVCQTFLVGFWPGDDQGRETYTEPVTACGGHRTVLARNVPNNTHYIVLYNIDYLGQGVAFRIWH